MDYTSIIEQSEHYANLSFDLNKVLQQVEPQLVTILLNSKSTAISSQSALFPCWRDKDKYQTLYNQYIDVSNSEILTFIQSISFIGTNFDCNFDSSDIYFAVSISIPWESGYEGGTQLAILFKNDFIIYACDHIDKLARTKDDIRKYEVHNLLITNS